MFQDVQKESDLYEHIKDSQGHHDKQTLDAATDEQQLEQPVPNVEEEEDTQTDDLHDDDDNMAPDDKDRTQVRTTKTILKYEYFICR